MDNCEHYFRNCKLVSPCCDKIYTCRFCHNENEDHEINRFEIKEIICCKCNKQQNVSNQCVECNIEFAKYFCNKCNFFDDRIERNYYHCDKCGICRVANDKKYFHCDICNTCLLFDENHKCNKNVFDNNCPICLENLFHSTRTSIILDCSHSIHKDCLDKQIQNNKLNCPLCRKSIYSGEGLKKMIEYIDNLIQENPFSEEILYDIKCNDCLTSCQVKFHPFGMKCSNCGSYNTSK